MAGITTDDALRGVTNHIEEKAVDRYLTGGETGEQEDFLEEQIFQLVSSSSEHGQEFQEDGIVGIHEFTRFAQERFGMSEAEAQNLFAEFNKDGEIGLSEQEFREVLSELKGDALESPDGTQYSKQPK